MLRHQSQPMEAYSNIHVTQRKPVNLIKEFYVCYYGDGYFNKIVFIQVYYIVSFCNL